MPTLIWLTPLTVLMAEVVALTHRTLGRGNETDPLVDRDPDIGVYDIDRRRRLDLPSSAGIPTTKRRNDGDMRKVERRARPWGRSGRDEDRERERERIETRVE
jgi:hypothetical protein